AEPALLALPVTLQRRGMIRHVHGPPRGWSGTMRLRDASNRSSGACRPACDLQGGELRRCELGKRRPAGAGIVLEALDPGDEVLGDGAERDLRRQIELVREAREAEQ